MKILCIGDSNLVMRHGISAAIPASQATAGLPFATVENLSVGGTGSLFDWERVHRHTAAAYDPMLINYGINDFFARRNDPALWRAGFAGLLQAVRQRFPSAPVVNLLLGRGDLSFWTEQALLYADMRQEPAAQGRHTLNVDSHLKQDRVHSAFPLLHQEYNHYAVLPGHGVRVPVLRAAPSRPAAAAPHGDALDRPTPSRGQGGPCSRLSGFKKMSTTSFICMNFECFHAEYPIYTSTKRSSFRSTSAP